MIMTVIYHVNKVQTRMMKIKMLALSWEQTQPMAFLLTRGRQFLSVPTCPPTGGSSKAGGRRGHSNMASGKAFSNFVSVGKKIVAVGRNFR